MAFFHVVSQIPMDYVSSFACRRRLIVPAECNGRRLDIVLAHLAEATRSQMKILIDEQRVWVDGTNRKASALVSAGEVIEFLPFAPEPMTATPQDIPLDVLYEDEYLAAINKPPGMVV